MNYFEKGKDYLIYRYNGESVRVSAWGDDSFRVESVFLGDIPEGSIALADKTELPQTKEVTVSLLDDEHAEITNGLITAKMFVQGWGKKLQLSFYNSKTGKLYLQEITNGNALALNARSYVQQPGGSFRIKQSFISDPEEKIYGMGQYQEERMNLKGTNLELAHRNSQASIPFYVSSLGYGFLWHNAAIGEVHFGTDITQWVGECSDKIDYYITCGDTPADIMHHYMLATGLPPMMPEYGMGYWQCKLRYYNQEQVLEIAREYKKRGIPLNVLVIDYYHWNRCGDWRFSSEFFPDPKKMFDELHEMGIEPMVSVWPQVDYRSENYEEMKQQGLLVKSTRGIDIQMLYLGNNVFIDTTNERGRKYLWSKIKQNYADIGVNTFWLDEAEPEFTEYDHTLYRYAAGPAAKIGNIYPREYARAFYEGQKAQGQEDIINLIRCAWVGSAKYGALVWSGDIFSSYEDFRKQICAGIHMGLAGIPWWTTDIGGFHGGNIESHDFQELLIRWFEFGTFCPVMRMHGDRAPHTDIYSADGERREHTGAPNEVWSYGEDNCRIMTKYIQLREKMRDYTRSVMKTAHEQGDPVIRALFYEFPSDNTCYDITDEYMYGPDYLVAPVCHAHEFSRKVYLPAGSRWKNYFDGQEYEGGQWITQEAPIDVIPVYTRL